MKAILSVLAMMMGVAIIGQFSGCAIPRLIWPQSDMASSRAGSTTNEQTVLLASRSSKFKKVLVEKLTRAVTAENMAVEIVGIENLKTYDAESYAGVVVISTCLAWGVDPLVRKFVERHPGYKRIVLVITSDSGWLPQKTDFDVDAMTSASLLSDADVVSRSVMARLHQKLGHN